MNNHAALQLVLQLIRDNIVPDQLSAEAKQAIELVEVIAISYKWKET